MDETVLTKEEEIINEFTQKCSVNPKKGQVRVKRVNSGAEKHCLLRRTNSKNKSKNNIYFKMRNLSSERANIEWQIASEQEHSTALEALAECIRNRHTSKRNIHLKERDYFVIDLLTTMASSGNRIEDQSTHNKWVSQTRFYYRVSEFGWRKSVYLEESKPSQISLIQRQLTEIFKFWWFEFFFKCLL